jgi:hypothetical protein
LCVYISDDKIIIRIRIPKRVKLSIDKAKINIDIEVNNYLEAKTKSIELYSLLPQIFKRAKKRKVLINSTKIVKEDRYR